MHILLGILGVLSVAMIWYWRMKAAREAAGELANAADGVGLDERETDALAEIRRGLGMA